MPSSCSAKECARDAVARGMCKKHYSAWHGSPTRPPIDTSPAARFGRKFERGAPEDCWEWKGERYVGGYGVFILGQRKRMTASGYALTMATGGRPDGAHALHKCDNPPCVNPNHLYWGTDQDNANDKVSRDRQPRGDTHRNSLLTAERVLELRQRYAAGESASSIAESLGVSANTISSAATFRTWRHVGGPLRAGTRKYQQSKQQEVMKEGEFDL